MTTEEIKLRCLEMAVEHVKREVAQYPAPQNFLDRVAEIQTWFYDRIVEAPKPATVEKPQKSKDKPPDMFK